MRNRVAYLSHPLGSGPVAFWTAPDQSDKGMAHLLEEKGFETIIPELPGHGTASDLARVTEEEWLEFTKNKIRTQLNRSDVDEIYLIGFSLGGLLILSALLDLRQEYEAEAFKRVHVLVANTPVYVKGLPWSVGKVVSLLGRRTLGNIRLKNKPRKNEPNHEYLNRVLVSKELPLSAIIAMYRLVWRLVKQLRQVQAGSSWWKSFRTVSLLQATPDGVIHPRSVETLQRLIGEKATVTMVEGATHGLPEPTKWEEAMSWLDENTS